MITKEDYTKFRLRTGDTDGIVNYGLSLKDVFLTAMFNEKKDGIYISFRSIGNFPVNDFAKTYFNGGGHKNAAGGFSNMTLKETVKNFVNIIKSLKNIKDGYQ
jgi:phosphoesterase RecJ-like protein